MSAAGRASATAEVLVEATPEEAFAIFTDEIGLWWRTGTPYWNDRERGRSVRIETFLGGYDRGWKELLGWFAEHTNTRRQTTGRPSERRSR